MAKMAKMANGKKWQKMAKNKMLFFLSMWNVYLQIRGTF
jgi:hypothetical protein